MSVAEVRQKQNSEFHDKSVIILALKHETHASQEVQGTTEIRQEILSTKKIDVL